LIFYLLQGATLGLTASVTPGPFQAFLLSQTLKNGWRQTLPAALAPLISDGPIVFLVLLILTQTPTWFLSGLQIGGGLFILYLARGAVLSLKKEEVTPEFSGETARRSLWKGVLMNALSPGPYLFWTVLAGPIVLQGWRQSPGLGFSFVLGFYGTLIGGFAAFVILFATAGHLGPRVSKGLTGLSAVALLIFGLYQLGTGIAGVIG
jgi:threonine/homoserine/homoserine lactone efflux protein